VKLTIAAYRTHATRGTQITLSQTDENGRGWGRRLAGPKHYNSGTTELVSAELDETDAREIRKMLDIVFPAGRAELRDQVLTEEAAKLRAACPHHGDADPCLIDCQCPAADALLAARTAPQEQETAR
jgi:hypothetical protein